LTTGQVRRGHASQAKSPSVRHAAMTRRGINSARNLAANASHQFRAFLSTIRANVPSI
jgi:hypothetical protein